MTVKILSTDQEGNQFECGTLYLEDGHVVAWPRDSPLLQNMVKEMILISEDGNPRVIDPGSTPMNFLKNLHNFYSSPTLWATKANP